MDSEEDEQILGDTIIERWSACCERKAAATWRIAKRGRTRADIIVDVFVVVVL